MDRIHLALFELESFSQVYWKGCQYKGTYHRGRTLICGAWLMSCDLRVVTLASGICIRIFGSHMPVCMFFEEFQILWSCEARGVNMYHVWSAYAGVGIQPLEKRNEKVGSIWSFERPSPRSKAMPGANENASTRIGTQASVSTVRTRRIPRSTAPGKLSW